MRELGLPCSVVVALEAERVHSGNLEPRTPGVQEQEDGGRPGIGQALP